MCGGHQENAGIRKGTAQSGDTGAQASLEGGYIAGVIGIFDGIPGEIVVEAVIDEKTELFVRKFFRRITLEKEMGFSI